MANNMSTLRAAAGSASTQSPLAADTYKLLYGKPAKQSAIDAIAGAINGDVNKWRAAQTADGGDVQRDQKTWTDREVLLYITLIDRLPGNSTRFKLGNTGTFKRQTLGRNEIMAEIFHLVTGHPWGRKHFSSKAQSIRDKARTSPHPSCKKLARSIQGKSPGEGVSFNAVDCDPLIASMLCIPFTPLAVSNSDTVATSSGPASASPTIEGSPSSELRSSSEFGSGSEPKSATRSPEMSWSDFANNASYVSSINSSSGSASSSTDALLARPVNRDIKRKIQEATGDAVRAPKKARKGSAKAPAAEVQTSDMKDAEQAYRTFDAADHEGALILTLLAKSKVGFLSTK